MKTDKVFFLDIETVPQYRSYADLPALTKELWDKKALKLKDSPEEDPEETYHKAGLFAEFGKIVCIVVGIFTPDGDIRYRIFSGTEEEILLSFSDMVDRSPGYLLAAHNGKGFDFPFMARRYLINGIEVPRLLDIRGKKPWEIPLLDTMEVWSMGQFNYNVSLRQLAQIFDIVDPKGDIDGTQVWKVFYEDNDIDRIVEYCTKDVEALMYIAQRI